MLAVPDETGGYPTPAAMVEAMAAAAPGLLGRFDVTGVDVGLKTRGGRVAVPYEFAIRVYVVKKLLPGRVASGLEVPRTIHGFQTDVIEVPATAPLTGPVDARAATRTRPLRGGLGIIACRATVENGTLGLVINDPAGQPVIVSNFHVLCLTDGAHAVGDPIAQPGAGSVCPADTVATLEGWVQPVNGGTDAAYARVLPGVGAIPAYLGHPPPTLLQAAVQVGWEVEKYGLKTGYTRGVVTSVTASVPIPYGGAVGTVTFNNVVVVTGVGSPRFSDSGDSGAACYGRAPNTLLVSQAGLRDFVGICTGADFVDGGSSFILQNVLSALGLTAPNDRKEDLDATGAYLRSGAVAVGVTIAGELSSSYTVAPPGVTSSISQVGLLLFAASGTDYEAVSRGTVFEGWGLSSTGMTSGWAARPWGRHNFEVLEWTYTATTARSVALVDGALRIAHSFSPLAVGSFGVEVTVTNTSAVTRPAVRYRRSVNFDIEPTGDYAVLTSRARDATGLVQDHTIRGGGGSLDPAVPILHSGTTDPARPVDARFLAGPSYPAGGANDLDSYGEAAWLDHGPGTSSSNVGATVDLLLGDLAPGGSTTFYLLYGAYATRAEAVAAINAAGCAYWAIACPAGVYYPANLPPVTSDSSTGTPATFVFAVASARVAGWAVGRR